ncbi:hypothetical protein SAMN02910456_02419 [Ruminococcaceae bacterium YRB3002]|nr:hypothetical protein SAMN02910456_02419 [Ruminococcaceae bacterium YRB3002]
MQKDNPDNDEATVIHPSVTLTNADGVYTLTIPAEFVETNYNYYICLNDGNDNRVDFGVSCFV